MDSAPDELLEAAKAGERAALEKLLAREEPRIWRFASRMCANADDAREVLQETMLAVARTVGGFRGASSVSTWLFTIARSHCIKRRRRTRFGAAKHEDAAMIEIADHGQSPEEAVRSKEIGDAVEKAIGALEPKYREVLVLRDVEELSAPEVAEVLGLRVDAVKSRLHRARAAVRTALAPTLGLPDKPPTNTCPDTAVLFSKYLEDDIDPELCARMQAHVEKCERCTGTCQSLRKALTVCRTSRSDTVPPEVKASVREALAALLRERDARP